MRILVRLVGFALVAFVILISACAMAPDSQPLILRTFVDTIVVITFALLGVLVGYRHLDGTFRRAALLAAAGGLVGLSIWLIALVWASTHRQVIDVLPNTQCINNLRNLVQLRVDRDSLTGRRETLGGGASVLAIVTSGDVDVRNPDNLEVLFCPKDETRMLDQATIRALRTLRREDLDRIDLRPFTSYVGRRPDRPVTSAEDVVFACLHHEGGIVVAGANGSVRFLANERLGYGPGETVEIGGASRSPLLKALSRD